MNDQSQKIARLEKELAAARDALRPFAEFYPSLKKWRDGPTRWTIQEEWPEGRPVLSRTYPIDGNRQRICHVFVSDFKRAAGMAAPTHKDR